MCSSDLKLDAGQTGPVPVLLTATAKNASQKILKINKTFWVANATTLGGFPQTGKTQGSRHDQDENQLIQEVNERMGLGFNSRALDGGASSRFQKYNQAWDLVGFGPLFDVSEIRPQEEVKTQRLILLPTNETRSASMPYKLLRVKVAIPSYTKQSLVDDDLLRVVGGIYSPSKDFVRVGFCQVERTPRKNGLRWFFDKFLLPRDRFDDASFKEPAVRYCPTILSEEERDRMGAQVFTATYETALNTLDTSEEKK